MPEDGVDMGHTSDGRGIKPLRPEIVPGKSEMQIATEYRDRAIALLTPVVDLINEARRDGMTIAFPDRAARRLQSAKPRDARNHEEAVLGMAIGQT